MRAKLTDIAIRQMLAPPATTYVWDATLPGFGIRLSPKGKKTYTVQRGKQRERITLGHWPDMGLANARAAARKILYEPAEKVPGSTITFQDALTVYRATHLASVRQKTRKEQDRILSVYWRPLHHRPLNTITRADIATILDDLADRPTMQFNARSACRTFINWAHLRGFCTQFPRFKTPKIASRERVLSDQELAAIWAATSEPCPYHVIVRLLLCTGQRRNEIAQLRAEWVHDDHILFPASFVKNHRAHTLPLTPLVKLLIASHSQSLATSSAIRSSGMLFLARGTTLEAFNGWSKSKERLDRESGVSGWTLHDLRRTWSTISSKVGNLPHYSEAVLNHLSGTRSPIQRIYDRHHYFPEMHQALLRVEKYLMDHIVVSGRHETVSNCKVPLAVSCT